MPKLRAAKKSLKKNHGRRMRNKALLTTMRTSIKTVRLATDHSEAQAALSRAVSVIDTTAVRGAIHKRTAARYKSRLTKRVQAMA